MPKRTLLFALVLLSFINGCAYGSGWTFDFLIPRSDPGNALHAIAQQWMRERMESPSGGSDGSLEEVRSPLGAQNPEVDLEHLRRLIGWNALLQEVNALMNMPLDGEDIQRREILIRETFQAFCHQFGCEAFDGQLARVAALEARVLALLRGNSSLDSLCSSIVKLIASYEEYVRRHSDAASVGYWSCLVRYLSQEHVSHWLGLLRGDDGDLDARQRMERNLIFQALLYVRGTFREIGPLRNYTQDFGADNLRVIDSVLGGGNPIVLQIRRMEALDGADITDIVVAAAGGALSAASGNVFTTTDEQDQGELGGNDKSDEKDKSEDKKDEAQSNEDDDENKDDDDSQILPSNNENESEIPQMLEAAHAYMAWRSLQEELHALAHADVDTDVRRAWVSAIMPRFINAVELGYVRGDDLIALQEGIRGRILNGDDLAADWDGIQQDIEVFCEALLAQFSLLLKDEAGRKILVKYLKDNFLSPAITALWDNKSETLDAIVALNMHGQRLKVVMDFFDKDGSLSGCLPNALIPRICGALQRMRKEEKLKEWRNEIVGRILQVLESDRIVLVREAERESYIIGGEGVFCETLLPPELWLQVLECLFKVGTMSDVIHFISSSMYLHGIALAPRYDRVYDNDGTYHEVPATMNELMRLGHLCLNNLRYEDAFRCFAYMGCLGVLLDENFSGMLQSVLCMRNAGRAGLGYSDLCTITGPHNALYGALHPLGGHTITDLGGRLALRNALIDRVMDVAPRALEAHDAVVDSSLSLERRTHALARLQALLRYQNDQHIPIDHIWQIHTIVLTAGFTMEQVQSVIDILQGLCFSRMESKRKIDINMVLSILTDLLHIAGDGGVPIIAEHRIYALCALRSIVGQLPLRYFKHCGKSLRRIAGQYVSLEMFDDDDRMILELVNEILAIISRRQNSPQIIEVTDDSDGL